MFIKQIKQFISNLNSLRDFVDLVQPIISQKQVEEGKKNYKNLLPLLAAMNKIDPDKFPIDDDIREKIEKETIDIEFEIERVKDIKAKSVTFSVKDKTGIFSKALGEFIQINSQVNHLYKTSLISIISSAEWFISEILHAHYEKYSGAFNKDERLLSIEELKTFGDINDGINYLIDMKIEEILRGSLDDWIKHFKEKLKLSMGYLENDKDFLIEAGLKRNLLIHNNGIINSIFIKKLPDSFKNNYVINTPLSVDQNYLDKTISLFEKNLILIALELWKKNDPEDQSRGKFLIEVAFNNIKANRFEIGESFSFFILNDKKLPEDCRLIATINYWQSKKWMGKFEDIRKEVEDSDYSAKEDKFKLAKFALLDDYDHFFKLLPSLQKSDEITYSDLEEWPLFRNIRENEVYKKEFSRPKTQTLNQLE